MTTQERIEAFVQLGKFLEQFEVEKPWEGYQNGVSQIDFDEFNRVINQVHQHNGWFTPEMVRKAITGIRSWLKADLLEYWVKQYAFGEKPKTIAVIMAGNIPMVGFHDALCVLISGHKLLAKFSSDDNVLMPILFQYLIQIQPAFNDFIRITNNRLTDFDAVIATGSNNSARYFEQYFGKHPHIIRKNRTSIAVLDGTESDEELNQLGNDIFDYYGLGCRNVTKLYVPQGYDLNKIFGAIFSFKEIINHKKYGNNYDYHKAIYLMNRDSLLENGFIVFKEDKSIFSPIGIMFYEFYDSMNQVKSIIEEHKNEIQAVIGHGFIAFGNGQKPAVNDYADGVDTMEFLVSL